MFSSHLPVEEGHTQVLAVRFAEKLGLLPDRGFAPPAPAQDLDGVGGAQVQGVLAEFPAQAVQGAVEFPDPLRPEGILEEAVLDAGIGRQFEQDDARGPVELPGTVQVIEERPQEEGKFHGVGRGAAEPGLPAFRGEVVLPEQGREHAGGEPVAPGLDAGRLEIPQQVGEEVLRGFRGRCEGLYLADGGVGAFLLRGDGVDRFSPQFLPGLHARLGEALSHDLLREPGEIQGRPDAHLAQVARRGGANAPNRFSFYLGA
jgi:hypothetical protein